jgi:hypothetical protein
MSDLLFPDLLSLGIKITREPFVKVTIQESVSGRELASTWWTQPRYRYTLSFDGLRSTAALHELQTWMTFYVSQFGQWDSFLLSDPEDCTAVFAGFGVGNGSTTQFQLQRTLANTTWDGYTPIAVASMWDATGGVNNPYAITGYPRTNYCLYSQTLTNAAWTKTHLDAATSVMAPDGTFTASSFLSTATAASLTQTITVSTPPIMVGTFSVWLRAATATTISLGDGFGHSAAFAVTPTWSRFQYVPVDLGEGTSTVTIGANSTWGNAVTLEVWGAQVEPDTYATKYIATTTTATTVNPRYWPQIGEGFEPIYAVAPPVLVYDNATPLTLGTDYTVSSTGLVTFASPPSSGHFLSWSGNYYRRVRFDQDSMPLERIVSQMWKAGTIKLVSVVP